MKGSRQGEKGNVKTQQDVDKRQWVRIRESSAAADSYSLTL